jgi:hypothetical protein
MLAADARSPPRGLPASSACSGVSQRLALPSARSSPRPLSEPQTRKLELVARAPTFRPARTATKDGLRLAPSGSVVPGKDVTVAEPRQVLDWLRCDELERDQADEQSLALDL